MMKKLCALLLAVLLGLGMTAAMADVDDAYVGVWELAKVKLFGYEMDSEKLSYTVTIYIHEDGSGLLVKDENFAMFDLISDGGAYYTMLGTEKMPFSIDDRGQLISALTVEGMTVDMELCKAAPGKYESAVAAPMAGAWTLEKVALMGFEMDAETFGASVTVTVYEDGYARIAMDDEWYVARMLVQDGKTMAVDVQGGALPMALSEDGRLVLTIEEQGLTMNLHMTRLGGAQNDGSTVACDLCGKSAPAAECTAIGTLNLCNACYSMLFK